MTRFIAFLRAINVGGHTVKMDQLRKLFERMGFSNVETFIASGNVLFDSPARNAATLEKKIQDELRKSLGYDVATFIRSASELRDIARYEPFKPAQSDTLYIAFLPSQPEHESQQKLLSFRCDVDDFHVYGREIYWLCRKKFSESTFSGALLEKTVCMPATIRNITTVRKLAARCNNS